MKKSVNILIEGQALDLTPGTGLTLERYNPVFDFGTVQGSKIYRFTVPYSRINDRLFQYAADPQTVSKPRPFYAELIADGDLVEKGYVYLEKVVAAGYEISFGSNLGSFFGDLQDVPLNLIDFGSVDLPADHADIAPENTQSGQLWYAFPTIQNAFFFGNNAVAGFNSLVNEYDPLAGYNAAAPMVPFLSLHWVIRKLAELCDFRVEGEFMDDPDAQRLLLYNTFALDGAPSMELRNHLPADISVRTLFLALKLPPFGVASFFDVQRRVIILRYTEERMATPTLLDISQKTLPQLLPGSILDRRLELDWELDPDDGLMKTVPAALEKYTAEPDDEETLFTLRGKFSTLAMDAGTGLPRADQLGITVLTAQKDKKFKARLLYWHGLVDDVPTAKSSYGSRSLSFTGPNNLRVQYWKRYEAFRKRTFPMDVQVMLTANDLTRLDFHRRAGHELAVHLRGVDYYVSAIKARLPLTEYSTLTLWKR
jgi:hypothetical protein